MIHYYLNESDHMIMIETMYLYMCVYRYVCMYTCKYVPIYIYIYIYIEWKADGIAMT